ncbi:TRAP transporter small permease subunit [Chelativorans sp. ZYF759]|uniref:TRAP transporter small permease subunit n=1 Tax=Chelativorans sp. ZYF759 TaxID=2692213 RepID=UPI00145D8510|nr:TRAP transporter small permease subunit [Chelativorans sp. ZYF759]NMG41888.1 TRAP transporter small permease subunit [Chelativorans sp. ZYF759]
MREPAQAQQARRRTPGLIFEWLSALGGLLIVMLMCVIGMDILGRALLNRPLRGVAEIASLTIVAIVFLQLPQAIRGGRMLRSDGLLMAIGARAPRAASFLNALNALLLAALLILIFMFGYQPFLQSWRIGEYIGALGDFTAPIWPVRLMILVGCVFGAAYAVVMLAASLREIFRANARPRSFHGGPT